MTAADGRRPRAWSTLLLGTLLIAFLGLAATSASGSRAQRRGARAHGIASIPPPRRRPLARRRESAPRGREHRRRRGRLDRPISLPGRAVQPARGLARGRLLLWRRDHRRHACRHGGALHRHRGSRSGGRAWGNRGAGGLHARWSRPIPGASGTRWRPRRLTPITTLRPVISTSGLLTLARPLWSGAAPPSINGIDTIAPLPVDRALAASYTDLEAEQPVIATVSGWGDVEPRADRRAQLPRRPAIGRRCRSSPKRCAEKSTRGSNRRSPRA